MVKYNASLPYDRVFFAQDIAGSIAFARANVATGILTESECKAICSALEQIKSEWSSNTFVAKPDDEDIHTANERRLCELVGKDIGGKLHTGRSRNDQVATDMRMWLRDELRKIDAWLCELLAVCAQRAEAEMDVLVRPWLLASTDWPLTGRRCPGTPISKRPSPCGGRTGSSRTPRASRRSWSGSASSSGA